MYAAGRARSARKQKKLENRENYPPGQIDEEKCAAILFVKPLLAFAALAKTLHFVVGQPRLVTGAGRGPRSGMARIQHADMQQRPPRARHPAFL